MKGIFRYDGRMTGVSSKVKPEPWMHLAYEVTKDGNVHWVIYVWDTREILDEGHNFLPWWSSKPAEERNRAFRGAPKANDNHQPLKGKNAEQFNKLFNFK